MYEEFQKIYETYHQMIYYFILRIVYGHTEVAEELTQETFYQTMISFHRYRGECDIQTWICQIAKNTCYRYFKKNPVNVSMDSDEFSNLNLSSKDKSPQDIVEELELTARLKHAILRLKKKYQDVIIYRIYFELSFAQIAKLVNISENSAKVIFFRGKEMLKKELEEGNNG